MVILCSAPGHRDHEAPPEVVSASHTSDTVEPKYLVIWQLKSHLSFYIAWQSVGQIPHVGSTVSALLPSLLVTPAEIVDWSKCTSSLADRCTQIRHAGFGPLIAWQC